MRLLISIGVLVFVGLVAGSSAQKSEESEIPSSTTTSPSLQESEIKPEELAANNEEADTQHGERAKKQACTLRCRGNLCRGGHHHHHHRGQRNRFFALGGSAMFGSGGFGGVPLLAQQPSYGLVGPSVTPTQVVAPMIQPQYHILPTAQAQQPLQIIAPPVQPLQIAAPSIPQFQVLSSPVQQVLAPSMQQLISPSMPQVIAPPMQQIVAPSMPQVIAPPMQQVIAPPMQQVIAPPMQQVVAPPMQQIIAPPMQQVVAPPMQQVVAPQPQQPFLQVVAPSVQRPAIQVPSQGSIQVVQPSSAAAPLSSSSGTRMICHMVNDQPGASYSYGSSYYSSGMPSQGISYYSVPQSPSITFAQPAMSYMSNMGMGGYQWLPLFGRRHGHHHGHHSHGHWHDQDSFNGLKSSEQIATSNDLATILQRTRRFPDSKSEDESPIPRGSNSPSNIPEPDNTDSTPPQIPIPRDSPKPYTSPIMAKPPTEQSRIARDYDEPEYM